MAAAPRITGPPGGRAPTHFRGRGGKCRGRLARRGFRALPGAGRACRPPTPPSSPRAPCRHPPRPARCPLRPQPSDPSGPSSQDPARQDPARRPQDPPARTRPPGPSYQDLSPRDPPPRTRPPGPGPPSPLDLPGAGCSQHVRRGGGGREALEGSTVATRGGRRRAEGRRCLGGSPSN